MASNQSNISRNLLFAILGGFVAYMVWNNPSIDVDIKAYQTQINILEQRIDSIQSYNNHLQLEADSLNTVLVEYNGKIKILNRRIYVIKKETEQKLSAIDSFGGSQLQEFFSDRYRQLEDSID
jgi:regulator of replication initiation timing